MGQLLLVPVPPTRAHYDSSRSTLRFLSGLLLGVLPLLFWLLVILFEPVPRFSVGFISVPSLSVLSAFPAALVLYGSAALVALIWLFTSHARSGSFPRAWYVDADMLTAVAVTPIIVAVSYMITMRNVVVPFR